MSNSVAKDVTISGTDIDGNTVELEIPATGKKVTLSNDITNFNRPKNNPSASNPRETRALNMNRIAYEIQLSKAKVGDDYAAKNHNGSGDRPDLDNKEEWINRLYKLFISGNIVDLKAVNTDTLPETSEYSGYIHNLDWQEKARNESSIYDVTLKVVDEVPMNS